MRNFTMHRSCQDDKSINKVCLQTLVGGEEPYVIDIQKWSILYANASKAIHPPYMEISLVPDTYNAAACLMVEFGSSHRTDALLGT